MVSRRNFLSTLAGGVVFAGLGGCTGGNTIVPADNLIANIDKFVKRKIKTEGLITHVCGFNGMRMKMMSDNGDVLVIIPHDSNRFDSSLNEKRLIVYGLVKEARLSKKYIDEKEKERALLCHVDQRPCRDINWVNAKVEAGVAGSISKKDIDFLRKKLEQQGKDYVSIVSIVCEEYEVIEDNTLTLL
jgi:hypothetical protein